MLANRRNVVFRVSIVINVAFLLYAAMHLSGSSTGVGDWVPVAVPVAVPVSAEGSTELRYFASGAPNETSAPSARSLDETTSQKTPSTHPTTNKTASSTVSLIEVKANQPSALPSESDVEAETLQLDQVDENALSDGTLTRLRELLACNERDFLPRTQQRGDFWVLHNWVRADHGTVLCHETITYTTHAGFEYLDNVQPLVERWMAPISLAIHAPGADLAPTVDSIRYLRDCLGSDLVRQFVSFHVFFSHKHVPSKIPNPDEFLLIPYNCTTDPPYLNVNSSTTYMKKSNLLYPVNVARNVARDAALTHYILASDIELYPSPYLVPRFLNMVARNNPPLDDTTRRPRVFPISIFEVDAKFPVPLSKTDLKAMLVKKTAIPFHKFVCPNCHNIPQGDQWIKANETSQMDVFHVGKRIGKFVHWEPIFIGTHQDPYYDERLSWDGKKDKMTQGYILCVKDYDFMILNNAFLCHKPGIKRYVKNAKRDTIAGRQSGFVNKVIMPELKKLFGTRKGCAL